MALDNGQFFPCCLLLFSNTNQWISIHTDNFQNIYETAHTHTQSDFIEIDFRKYRNVSRTKSIHSIIWYTCSCMLYAVYVWHGLAMVFNMIVGAKWILFICRMITFSASVVVAPSFFPISFSCPFLYRSHSHTRRRRTHISCALSLWLYSFNII